MLRLTSLSSSSSGGDGGGGDKKSKLKTNKKGMIAMMMGGGLGPSTGGTTTTRNKNSSRSLLEASRPVTQQQQRQEQSDEPKPQSPSQPQSQRATAQSPDVQMIETVSLSLSSSTTTSIDSEEQRQPQHEKENHSSPETCLRLKSSGEDEARSEGSGAVIPPAPLPQQQKRQQSSSSPSRHGRALSSVPFCKTFNISERAATAGIFRNASSDSTTVQTLLSDMPHQVGAILPGLRRCRSSEPVYNHHPRRPFFDDDDVGDDDDYFDDGDNGNENNTNHAFVEPISRKNSLIDQREKVFPRPQPLDQVHNDDDDVASPSALSAASSSTLTETWFTPRQRPMNSFDWFESPQSGQELRQRKGSNRNISLSVETTTTGQTMNLVPGNTLTPLPSSTTMTRMTPLSARSTNTHGSSSGGTHHHRGHRRQWSRNRGYTAGGRSSRFVIPIEHPLKILWDVITVVLSFVHTYLTHAAIRDRNVGFYQSPFIVFCDFWFLIDILLNFVTERRTANGDGILRDHRAICARYLTSWFAIDAFSLFPWEAVYVKPIIEAANRRNWIEKLPRRYKAVLRVTQRLRGRHFRWFGNVARHTKVHGVGSRRLLHLIIKYAPKYFMFLRNMKAIVAVRLLRFVHWMRRLVKQHSAAAHGNSGGSGVATSAYQNHNIMNKSDESTRSLSTREFEDEDLLLDGEGDGVNRLGLSSHSNVRPRVEVVYQEGWEIGLFDDDDDDEDDEDDGVPL